MNRVLARIVGRWEDRAAVRSEMELDPTLRRRFDRLPRTMASHRTLRAERRARRRDAAQVDAAISSARTGFYDTRRITDRGHR